MSLPSCIKPEFMTHAHYERLERYSGGRQDLHTLLGEADLEANPMPSTPKTRDFFNVEAFPAMKPVALFFNVGRGGTIDVAAHVATSPL